MRMPDATSEQHSDLPEMAADNPILTEIKLADSWLSRLRGLLGSTALLPHQGLLLSPCNSIHTLGMPYALDVVFLAPDGTLLKLVTPLPPWRGAVCLNASAVLELAAGTAARLGLTPGRRLIVTPTPNRPGYAAIRKEDRP